MVVYLGGQVEGERGQFPRTLRWFSCRTALPVVLVIVTGRGVFGGPGRRVVFSAISVGGSGLFSFPILRWLRLKGRLLLLERRLDLGENRRRRRFRGGVVGLSEWV